MLFKIYPMIQLRFISILLILPLILIIVIFLKNWVESTHFMLFLIYLLILQYFLILLSFLIVLDVLRGNNVELRNFKLVSKDFSWTLLLVQLHFSIFIILWWDIVVTDNVISISNGIIKVEIFRPLFIFDRWVLWIGLLSIWV
jgi:hypothetical protein